MHPDTTIRLANILDLEGLGGLFDQYRQFYDCASDLNKARGWLEENLEAGRSTIFVADNGAHLTRLYPALSRPVLRGSGRVFRALRSLCQRASEAAGHCTRADECGQRLGQGSGRCAAGPGNRAGQHGRTGFVSEPGLRTRRSLFKIQSGLERLSARLVGDSSAKP